MLRSGLRPTPSYIRRTSGIARGSTNGAVVVYNTAAESSGTQIEYKPNAVLGDSFQVKSSGIYSITVTALPDAAGGPVMMSIRVGDTIENGTAGNEVGTRSYDPPSPSLGCTSHWTGFVRAGQYIWVIVNGGSYNYYHLFNQITIVGPL